jgi:phage I-like protein
MADEIVTAAVVSLAAGVPGGSPAASGWIKITPRGRVQTRDGRSYAFEPEQLASRFASDDVKVPIDFEHGIAKLASKGSRSDAIGWVEDMEARPDGLYAQVEWLDAGKAALAAKSHRYVSPTFPVDRHGNAQFIHSVALVTAPALSKMPALAHLAADNEDDDMLLAKLRSALSLPEDATEEEALAAIGGLVQVNLSANGNVQLLLSDLAKEKGEVRTKRAEEKADQAIRQGAFPPYMRDWAIATCSANEEAFDSFLSQVGQPLAHLFASPVTPAMDDRFRKERESREVATNVNLIADQLGIPADSLKGDR